MAAITRRELVCAAGAAAGMVALGGAAKAFASEGPFLRPPGGQNEAAFLASCIRCDRCRSVCPQGCVSVVKVEEDLLGARTPKLDFHAGYCDFCDKCIDACPTGALSSFDPSSQKLGVAVVDTSSCIAYTMGACEQCRDSCRYDALAFDDYGRPEVTPERCNGCGECVDACTVNVYRTFDGQRDRAIEVTAEGALL